jgi:hypothetical protein
MDPVVQNVLLATASGIAPAALLLSPMWWGQRQRPDALPVSRETLGPRAAIGPIVLALAALVSYLLLNRTEDGALPGLLPGASYLTWWPAIIGGALALGLATATLDTPAPLRALLRAALLAGIAFVSARGLVQHRWDAGTTICLLTGFAAWGLMLIGACERHASSAGPGATGRAIGGPLVLLVLGAGASQITIIGFATQSPAFQLASLAAALGVACALALLRPNLSLARGTGAVLATLIATVLLQATLFGTASNAQALVYLLLFTLGATAPLLADALGVPARSLPGLGFARLTWRDGAKLALAGAPIAAAVALALRNKPIDY